MVGLIGRKIVFTWKGAEIDGVREKGLSLSGEAIDISADEDDGVRSLLGDSSQDQLDLSLNGVTKNDTLMRAWMEGKADTTKKIGAVTLTWPDGRSISGDFRLNSYTETGTYNDAVTFEATLQSTGAWVYVPAP